MMCDNTQSIANQGSSFKRQYLKLLLGFYYVGVIDWIIGHVVELNFQLLLFSSLQGDQADILWDTFKFVIMTGVMELHYVCP